MEIYNKGSRSFVIKKSDCLTADMQEISDEMGNVRVAIKPEMRCEVTEEVGAKLIAHYPKEIMEVGAAKKKE